MSYVYKKVEKAAASGLDETPQEIKKKKGQQQKLQDAIRNYLEFIKSGNLSKAVAEALGEAEKESDGLKAEIESLEFQSRNRFKAPPREWIQHRLERFQETLNRNTVASALALKEVLGTIRMEPVLTQGEDPFWGLGEAREEIASVASLPRNDTWKPYYVAHTKIQTLALLDARHKGSNWSSWRRGRDLALSSRFAPYESATRPANRMLPQGRIQRGSLQIPSYNH